MDARTLSDPVGVGYRKRSEVFMVSRFAVMSPPASPSECPPASHRLVLLAAGSLTFSLLAGCGGDNKVGVYNAEPTVSIQSPPDGTSVDEGDMVQFVGLVSDDQTDETALLVEWSSDIDGVMTTEDPADGSGQVTYSTSSLSVGNHAITLAATDEQGERAEYTAAITVIDVPDAPSINIVHPGSGESGSEGDDFGFAVQVSDNQDAPDALYVAFESDVDGVFCEPSPDAIGIAECDHELTVGDHQLSLSVTDTSGLTTTGNYYFTVISGNEIDDDEDGYTEAQGDCNDGDSSVNPVATEYYNERDDDCDGVTDEGTVGFDDDGDGQTELSGDCDDTISATYTGAPEACDNADNDCDGVIDETTSCYDDDLDGLTEIDGDCNDASAVSYPGAPELEDGIDNDCDAIIDEGTAAYDDDFDGYTENAGDCNDGNGSIHPAATETCNGYDDNCDSSIDEQNASGCFTYYYDYDSDLYGSGSVAGKCLCAPSGSYTSAYNSDCYDYNASANPAASSYSTSPRGDTSYDYNCDGSESKYYTAVYSCGGWPCTSSTAGFSGSAPACGANGTWYTGCSIDWFSCDDDGASTVTQACR